MPGQLDLTFRQGETFSRTLRWSVEPLTYKSISAVSQLAPVRLTVAAHGIKGATRIAITGLLPATSPLNAPSTPPKQKEYTMATVTDPDTLELRDVNGTGFPTYVSGGTIQYYTQPDLTGYTAKMDIKGTPSQNPNNQVFRQTDPTAPPQPLIPILQLSTDNGRIVIDEENLAIQLLVDAETTSDLNFNAAMYDLKLIDPTGIVFVPIAGNVFLEMMITDSPS